MADADILFERRGKLGLITLNRPEALNALTHDMILRLERQLDDWRDDPSVTVVAIQSAGDRAFCAGGDVRALYDAGKVDGRNNWKFYADEYRLNAKIKNYSKPYVSLMDGIVMGGGVGVSIHGSLRIATERTVFAMPETGIGLFPDVGGTYFLPRLPGRIGMWLGLTGSRLKGQDVVRAGVCDLFVEAAQLPELIDVMAHNGDWKIALMGAGLHRGGLGDLPETPEIHYLFSFGSVELTLKALTDDGTEWAKRQHDTILTKSPTCTRIAHRQISTGADLEFEDCMRLEYRLARFCMTQPDFYEGVRAVIIDKDNAPKWCPPTLAEATDNHVAPAFELLGSEELLL
ncbi:MAG TPA: enoyl-CoA hydratase/isomerase family protein [Thermohalobaculum sp.]|nr:enoyl-CoA hydratase/isomerase family protein [Thermohalobaculum sp.]